MWLPGSLAIGVVSTSDRPRRLERLPSAIMALASDKLDSGVEIKMMRAGESDSYPERSQSVAIHYDVYHSGGTFANGKVVSGGTMWDSSRKRGKPLRFRLGMGQVIKGLDEGVSQLSVGARARIKIPPEMAYGERGFPGLVPPNTAIEFDIELLEVI